MKVVVTGGTGFTGSHLTRRMLDRGYDVTVLDNQKGLFDDEFKARGAKIIYGSVTDEKVLDEALEGADTVHHLAAAFRKVNMANRVYSEVNQGGMRKLLEVAKRRNVRKIVYCSTQGVHGNVASLSQNPPVPGDENSPIKPEDYYQFSKHQGEIVAKEFVEKEGMDITVLRPTALYGPGDPGRFLMLYKWVARGYFPFFGNGKVFYHPVYVENFVDAHELAAARPEAKGQTYIIADDKYYYIKDIVAMISEVMNMPCKFVRLPFAPMYAVAALVELLYKPLPWDPPIFRRRADWYRQNRGFKIDKARRELGYEPKVALREGLKITGQWYLDNGYLKTR
ncbi:MAG: NAD-dependent epimerase/dehydratase family protein [Kiritimatiellae bacterium]|nr:NAD-dependent epimerase/dehydratase family protein [Kiritimatiellia bacterium]